MKRKVNVKVIRPGIMSSIQDMGRRGYQAFGVPEAGAMDREAALIANLLLGNPEDAALIEITVMGLELEFDDTVMIAVAGGDLGFHINGVDAPMYQSICMQAGSRLSFEGIKEGSRAYLALGGEICLPKLMGSHSTYMRGKIGGYEGRMLEKDDLFQVEARECQGKSLADNLIRDYGVREIRVLLHRDEDNFTGQGINTFLTEKYTISNSSDRMGYRMEGPLIEHRDGADIISTAINFGAVQVPGHGQPIVMMADRQTVGGYAQIATVISADLPLLAQMLPGQEISFKEVSLREAQDIYRQRMGVLRRALA